MLNNESSHTCLLTADRAPSHPLSWQIAALSTSFHNTADVHRVRSSAIPPDSSYISKTWIRGLFAISGYFSEI